MPSRNWILILVAFVGLIVYVFSVGVGVGEIGHYPESYPYYQEPGGNVAGSESTARLNVQSVRYKQPCTEPQGHDESDLCAQYRAAEAAGIAAYWARWQAWLSIGGIIGLGFTVMLTIRATKAAVQSNEIARETAKGELRAYLGVEAHSIEPYVIDQGGKVIFRLQNYGQSPAVRSRTKISLAVGPCDRKNIVAPTEWHRESSRLPIDIPPQGTVYREVRLPGETMKFLEEMEDGTYAIFIELAFSYSDIFKRGHAQTTLFYARGKRYKAGHINMAFQGPEITTEPEGET